MRFQVSPGPCRDVGMNMSRRGFCAVVVVVVSMWFAGAGAVAADDGTVEPSATSSGDVATLTGVSIAPTDLAAGLKVLLYGGGTSVQGFVSLDLCRGPFPSEQLRTGRYQVAVVPQDSTSIDDQLVSVEALMYRDEAAATQAMTELATAARSCPASEFVLSGVDGDPPTNWRFHRAPDRKWKKVQGIQRLAYDVTLTDRSGASGREHLIYQRAGRLIVAVYGTPGMIASATPFAGRGEQRLVDTIAHRLASSPQAAVS
jgi:hypothetical protein